MKKNTWFVYTFLAFVVIGGLVFGSVSLLEFLGHRCTLDTFLAEAGFGVFDAFNAQCALTFIVVSLISFLSNNTNKVLWDDTISYSLIKPFGSNFIALSSYLIADLVIAGITIFTREPAESFFSLIICVLILVVVLYKIVLAYFSSDKIHKKLISQYRKAQDTAKDDYLLSLYQVTLQEIDQREYSLVYENIEFLLENDKKDVLYRILAYVSANEPMLYYEIAYKYDLLTDENVVLLSKSLISSLILTRNYVDLKKKLVEAIYDRKFEFKLPDRFAVLAIDSSLISNPQELQKECEFVNKELEGWINSLDKPIDLLYEAYISRDIFSFRIILRFLHEQYLDISHTISDAINNGSSAGPSGDMVWDYMWNYIRPSYLDKKEKERIKQILAIDEKQLFLLEEEKEWLKKLNGIV